VPLRVPGGSGAGQPVDLRLMAGGGALMPVRPLTPVSIGERSGSGVVVGSSGLRITIEGASVQGRVLGNQDEDALFSDISSDTDAVVAPTIRGVEMSALLSSPSSPQLLRYRVALPEGAELRAIDGGAVVWRHGKVLAQVLPPSARDAQGTAVPTTLSVSGDELLVRVSHRERDVAYPVLLDPEIITITETAAGWKFSSSPIRNCGGLLIHGTAPPLLAVIAPSNSFPQAHSCEEPERNYQFEAGGWFWESSPGGEPYVGEFDDVSFAASAEPSGDTQAAEWILAVCENVAKGNISKPPPSQVMIEAPSEACPIKNNHGIGVTLKTGEVSEGNREPVTVSASLSVGAILLTGPVLPASDRVAEEYGVEDQSAPSKPKCFLGKPVNCFTGNQVETQTDLSVGGRGPGLHWTRTYNSQLAATEEQHGPLGWGWTGSYTAHIVFGTREGVSVATVYGNDGSATPFEDPHGVWLPSVPLVQSTLAAHEANYIYTLPNQTKLTFNEAGRLLGEEDANGNAVTLKWSSEGLLESAHDGAGRELTFTYKEGMLEKVTDPMGRTVSYTYASGSLASVTEPGELTPRWQFKYNSEHELTSLTDGRNNTSTTEYDSSHRVIKQTDAIGRTREWEYYGTVGAETTETKITEPNGAKTDEMFDSEGLPTRITHAVGTSIEATTTYKYNINYDLIETVSPGEAITKYGYDSAGDRTSETNADGDKSERTYNTKHEIETETTPDVETTTIKRNSKGDPEVVERPAPGSTTQKTTYKYASNGDVESMTDPLEHTWKYAYDSYGDKTGETDPEGDKRTWEYNKDSEEIATVSPRGNVSGGEPALYTTSIERYASGRPENVVEPARQPAYGFAFGSKGIGNGQFEFPTLEAVTSSGNIWVSDSSVDRLQEFNAKGEYVAQFGTKGTGAREFKFPFGIAINSTTGNMYVSDYQNYRVQEFSSSGAFIRMFGYGVSNGKSEFEICTSSCQIGLKGSGSGQFGNPVGVAIDSSGNVWVADETNNRLEEYNENGGFIKQFGAKGTEAGQIKQPVGLAYDNGNLYVTEAGNQRVQEFTTAGVYVKGFGSEGTGNGQFKIPYAIAAAPVSNDLYVTDRENNRVEEFTATGEFIASLGSKGKGNGQFELPTGVVATAHEAVYVSDHSNQRVQEWTPPATRITKYTYDGNGNRETVTDADGNITKYTYDADNELTSTEAPSKTFTEAAYDAMGNVKSQTDANKHVTKYERNALEEVTEVVDPKERKTTKEYDAAGNLKTVTDAAKRTTTYSYDPANRLKEITYSDGKTHAVEYEYNKDGKVTVMKDGSGTTKYTYDQLDRLTEIENGHKEIAKYEYNLANEPTKITYPNGKAVTRTYDKDDRLEKVTDWSSHTTTFSYDPDSDLKATTFPSETKDEDIYAYNNLDQMSEVKMDKSSEVLASLVYTRDSDGQLKTIASKGLPGEENLIDEYDNNSRLTKGASIAYEYDAANNPTKLGASTYKYDSADELETGPGVKYTYNEMGQRTKSTPETGSTTTYGYDQAGNLISAERPKEGEKSAIEDSYAYNGEGLRTSQTISGATTYMAWDTTEQLPPLLLSDGTNSYIYGPGGLPVEQINNTTGVVLYLHHDQAGSTRLLTGSTGKSEATFTYDAYGNQTGHTGTATTPFGFDGQYTSSDTGLVYLRARVYDPATAQFLSVDPMEMVTRAPYNYAEDNPLNRGDATGLSSWNPFSESFWTEGNFISESPLNPIPYYEKEIESYENGCGYFASVAHGLEGAIAGTALFAGGEGADEADSAIADITFGHGARHLIGTGLDSGEVESAIQSQIGQSVSHASATGSFWGRTVVGGQTIEYRAYTLPNGTINVGTYYVVP